MENDYKPGFLKLYENGVLEQKRLEGIERLKKCNICPHDCGVNRIKGETGFCRAGKDMLIASYSPHFGEERPLVGSNGSGTIFFSYCNLKCVFCQNYDIIGGLYGDKASPEKTARMMLDLQEQGCHNINLVTPTQFVPQILDCLKLAAGMGLRLPLVYNCGGYESLETLALLEGIVDIYMPDIKYADEITAKKYSGIRNYPEVVKKAVKEMHRQVGDLKTGDRGIATRGLLVRHLVMPHGLAGTEEVMKFISREVSPGTFVNIMPQYYPVHKAFFYPDLSESLPREDYLAALKAAEKYGIHHQR